MEVFEVAKIRLIEWLKGCKSFEDIRVDDSIRDFCMKKYLKKRWFH